MKNGLIGGVYEQQAVYGWVQGRGGSSGELRRANLLW